MDSLVRKYFILLLYNTSSKLAPHLAGFESFNNSGQASWIDSRFFFCLTLVVIFDILFKEDASIKTEARDVIGPKFALSVYHLICSIQNPFAVITMTGPVSPNELLRKNRDAPEI